MGASKLSPFRDGWRHLRLILVYNPTFLFLIPGAVMLIVGSLISLLVFAQLSIVGRSLYLHSLILGCLLIILGMQAIGFGLCARAYGVYFITDQDEVFQRLRARFRLEHGLVLAAIFGVAGIALFGVVGAKWASSGFGTLGETRLALVAATSIVVSAQIFFTSFFLSILGLRRRNVDD